MGAIGVGDMGTNDLRDFINKPEVQMVAVCDVEAEHRNRAKAIVDKKYGHSDCTGYNDFRELIAREDIDAVMIAVPDHWHGLCAVLSARAGKDIHSQKPLAYSIAEGQAVCRAVEQNGIVWQTGSQQRSDKRFRLACELVRNGRIGKVHTVEVGLPRWHQVCKPQPVQPVPASLDYHMWLGPAPLAPYTALRVHWNWRWIEDYAHGVISDWGAHHLDIAQWGMGTDHSGPAEIQGQGEFPRDGLWNVPFSYKVRYRYAQGFTLIVADTDKLPQGIRFKGTAGWVYVNRQTLRTFPESLQHSVIGPEEVHLYKSDDHKGNFLACIRSRGQTAAPAGVAHRSVSIAHLGTIAMKTGRKLRWSPEEELFVGHDEANRFLSRPMRSPWRL